MLDPTNPSSFSKRVRKEIELFADDFVGKQFSFFSSPKIINDSVWGTQRFAPYELTIISLPIVQRLRQIRQMGFVNYVYPSAIHTRFEHSLGTAILSDKLFLYAKKDGERFLDDNDRTHIRIAALLHDIGHGMFSHTSEEIYGSSLSLMIDEDLPDNANPKPHEYFAYLLLQTEAFRDFFKKISSHYRMDIDSQRIANHIVGVCDNESQRYKVSFINGAFDADKLDYIYRDSHFSGIPLLLDLDRLMYEIEISSLDDFTDGMSVKDLTIGISGVSSLEQIVFNKMLLFSTIYHHQKVKACDCMFKACFEYITEKKIPLKLRKKKLLFDIPSDFLWFTDTEFMAAGVQTNDDELHRLIHNILYRRPLKRALVLSRKTVMQPESSTKTGSLMDLLSTSANAHEKYQFRRELALKIWKDAGEPCSKHEVWVDMPKPPSFKEADTTFVRTNRTDPNKDLKPLAEFFPTAQWTDQYNTHKLRGHVFGPEYCLEKIGRSAKIVLEKELDIELTDDAYKFCKNSRH